MKPDFKFTSTRFFLTCDPEASHGGHIAVPDLRATFRLIRDCNAMEERIRGYHNDPMPAWRVRFPNVAAAFDLSRGIVAHAVCDLVGHSYKDTGSYAGPEGAAEDFTCARCGDGFHHTYF